MAITNQERVGKALELLKEGLVSFVERELKAQHAQRWFEEARASVGDTQSSLFGTAAAPRWDVAALLSVMWNQWNVVFRKTLGQAERTLLSELRDALNVKTLISPRRRPRSTPSTDPWLLLRFPLPRGPGHHVGRWLQRWSLRRGATWQPVTFVSLPS